MKPLKILFFFGAGVSKPTGLPLADDLTHDVLHGSWRKHTDSTFYRNPSEASESDFRVIRLQKFLSILQTDGDFYFRSRRKCDANYEDLFFLARQVSDEFLGNVDNPAVLPFVACLKEKCDRAGLLGPDVDDIPYGIERLAGDTCDFIQCVVWRSLITKEKPQGMEAIRQLLHRNDLDELCICSLNHDLLVERTLKEESVRYDDGFGEPRNGLKLFKGEKSTRETKVKLCKLHGSINWFRYRFSPESLPAYEYGIPETEPHRLAGKDSADELDPIPQFLTGSYNKFYDYSTGVFDFMRSWANEMFAANRTAVVSGYSWCDRGINSLFFDWLARDRSRRIILLHRDPDKARARAKHGMQWKFDDFVSQKRLVLCRHWFCDLSAKDIVKFAQS